MAKVKGKVELCSCDKKYFKSTQGINDHTLFDRYNALENVVLNNIAQQYQHLLTQPVVDGNEITWFALPYNETTQLLPNLQGEEYQKYEQIKNQTLEHYKSVISRLKNDGKNIDAEFLEKAIKFVNDDFVYCYDDKIFLGIWGMQLKENLRESLGMILKTLSVPIAKPKGGKPLQDEEPLPLPEPAEELFSVRFNAGEKGSLKGTSHFEKRTNETISASEIPTVEAQEGYEFIGWDKNPADYPISEEVEFTAKYKEAVVTATPITTLPWYTRFWDWLRSLLFERGCLKWLLWLLLLILLILLFCWLFKSCNGDHPIKPIPSPIAEKPWIPGDPHAGDGGIYNPGDPYKTVPTPHAYKDVLPPQQGVLPPTDNPGIIREPGMPAIIGNRLNILMENEDKSIMDLAKEFKAKYPDDKYKVVYYDDVIKRMQIEMPTEERTKLKQEIPGKFAPTYELFVFDEALFESEYAPNDPAFTDPNKSWYLKAIRAPEAWDITKGLSKLTIAIVDNGFNLKHPELNSKVVMPYNVWTHSNEIFPQQVDHGTHVAGTALAIMDNGKGICGIAPKCSFMPIQVANKKGLMTTTSVLDGILYALYQGADIVNVSLGTTFEGLHQFPESQQQDLIQNHFKEEERLWNEILKIADKHKSTIVVAAGNDNVLTGIAAIQRPKNIITVSAVDKKNQGYTKTGFSNYGTYSTISAPGVDIYSSVGSNDYAIMEGTSMAAPIVTGCVALMKSLNANLTNEQIICILQGTGLSTSGNIGNFIQIDKALQKVKSGIFSDCGKRTENPSTGDVQVLLSWNNYNDLDLVCTDPSGKTVSFKNKKVPSGGQLEIDMNVKANHSKTPIENIYWATGSAPNGTYNVYLVYYKRHDIGINETPYTIKAKYGDKTEEFKGIIKKEDKTIHICSFTLGTIGQSQNPQYPNPPDTHATSRKGSLIQERERLKQELNRIEQELGDIGNDRNYTK